MRPIFAERLRLFWIQNDSKSRYRLKTMMLKEKNIGGFEGKRCDLLFKKCNA